jgi:hypothetical protein
MILRVIPTQVSISSRAASTPHSWFLYSDHLGMGHWAWAISVRWKKLDWIDVNIFEKILFVKRK